MTHIWSHLFDIQRDMCRHLSFIEEILFGHQSNKKKTGILLILSLLLVVQYVSTELCWHTWICWHVLSVEEPNLILIQYRVNSCWRQGEGGRIRSITQSIYRQRVETTLCYPWIRWIYSLLISVTTTFHQCHLPSGQWGVKKKELTGLNVLQCLSCIITHLLK